MRRAFTLMEVNLAILIMAGGILSIVGLYSFGYRENRQSAEDVAAAAYADYVVSPIIMALSDTNLEWSVFKDLKCYPGNKDRLSFQGWGEYLNSDGLINVGNSKTQANTAWRQLFSDLGSDALPSYYNGGSLPSEPDSEPDTDYLTPGLIIIHEKDSAIAKVAFRASRQESMLMSAPIYYTEVRFQGRRE